MSNDLKKLIKIGGLAIFFTFIIVYAFFRSKNLIFGVHIKDVNIVNGTTYTEQVVNITGNAKNAIKLSLNGREISINQEGDFDETIALFPGYNVVTIEAQDKFGNSDEEIYKLIYSPAEAPRDS